MTNENQSQPHAPHPSLWVREATALGPEPQPFSDRADVVVIGGGVAGVSATLQLARAGVEPVLLEAGTVATRASGRNDGQMLLGLGEHYNRIVGQFGVDHARLLWGYIRNNHDRMEREITELGIDCGFAAAGGLRLAETEHEQDELGEASALLTAEKIEHALIPAGELAQWLPEATGFHGALHLPGEAVVQPAAMVRGLARAARTAGARIYEQAPVTSVAPHGEGQRITLADGRHVDATIVVHCTSALARDLDPSGFLQEQLFPFRGQILATDPLPAELAARFPAYAMSSNFCYEYFRMHGGRFVIGGMRWSVAGEEQNVVDDATHHDEVSANLRRYVDEHFPVLREVPMPHVWTGIMAGTGDGLPLVGELPGQPGVFALMGFNGYGLSFACEAGATLAEQIVEGKASHPAAELFVPRRFR